MSRSLIFFCPDSYRDNSDCDYLFMSILARVLDVYKFTDVPFDVTFF